VSQWGIAGPAYQAANPYQDNQACVNFYVEVDPNAPNPQQPTVEVAEAKTELGLLGAPGLSALTSAYSGAVRGAWGIPGNTTALFVVGSTVVLGAAVGWGPGASFSFSTLGTIGTSSGPVNIRDNGAGHIAVIVDGSTKLYVYNVSTGVFSLFAGGNYLGATNVAELDGWLVFNQPGTQKFYTSPVYWNGTDSFDGTYFSLADNTSDNLVTLAQNQREIWLFGESHTEPWYNAGNATFPFSRIDGAMLQIGCAAAQSVARTGKGFIWLARSERGENTVVTTQGYQFNVVSSPAVSWALNQYSAVSDAIGYTYTEEGHEFYVLTFPTADVTWVYDLTTNLWHQRASFDSATGLFHRHRANCLVNLAGNRIVGDYTNGRIYRQSRDYYSDDTYPLVSMRRAPHVWDKNDRNRVINSRLQIEFFPGSGLATGQGSDPQAMLKWSNDGGRSWSNEHWTSIGAIGQTTARAIWRRLGAARDRVYEVRISDPVRRDITGASLISGATGS
jgi:hypothetical protein